MAITNYIELKNQVIRFLHREDFNLDFDIFIGMVESEIFNNKYEILNSSILSKSAKLINTEITNKIQIPNDFLKMRDIRINANGENKKIIFKELNQMNYNNTNDYPIYYTIDGDYFIFDTNLKENTEIDIVYFSEFIPLDEINDSNAILNSNPNLYFYGCMWAAKLLSNEENESQMFYQAFINSIIGMNKKSKQKNIGNNPSIRVDNFPKGI
jgi:hypothetical protein